MELSPREQKLLADAHSSVATWKYTRWLGLLIVFLLVGIAIGSQFTDSMFGRDPVLVLQALLIAIGVQGLIWILLRWDNETNRLLVRLADENQA